VGRLGHPDAARDRTCDAFTSLSEVSASQMSPVSITDSSTAALRWTAPAARLAIAGQGSCPRSGIRTLGRNLHAPGAVAPAAPVREAQRTFPRNRRNAGPTCHRTPSTPVASRRQNRSPPTRDDFASDGDVNSSHVRTTPVSAAGDAATSGRVAIVERARTRQPVFSMPS